MSKPAAVLCIGDDPKGLAVRKALLVCGLLAILLLPLAAQSAERSEPLRFLGNESLPPMISLHEGRPEGVVVDLAYAVAEKTGLSVKVEAMNWPEAQQLVAAGKADALLQINPTPERQAIFDFSDVLLHSTFHIFRRIDRRDIRGLDSLKGQKVGVEPGGFPIQYLQGLQAKAVGAGKPDEIQVIVVPSWEAAFKMLHDGQLDAVFVDRWVGEYELYLHRFSDITRVDPPVVTDHSRIAVKKGNAKLLARINFGLREIERDGTRQAILNRWQAKEIVYLTKESIHRWMYGGILAIAVLLFALVYARVVKQRNISLEEKVEAQERLRLFIEYAPVSLAMFDRDMRYVHVSRHWRTGYNLGDRPLHGVSHYEVFPEISEGWKQAHRRGLAGEVLRSEGDRFERTDGSVQWVRWEIRPWYDAAGAVAGILIFSEDITERKQAEEALRQSEERWATTLHSIGDAVISTCAQGKIIFMNRVAEKLTGWPFTEAQGRDLEEVFNIVNEVTRNKPESPVAKVIRLGQVAGPVNHTALISRNGTERPIDDTGAPIRDRDGQVTGVVLVFHDISEQRRAEKAVRDSERLAMTGRMASTLAHEIHNPLDTVGNLLFLIGHDPEVPETVRPHVALASEELARVTQMTRHMLSFQREAKNPVPIKIRHVLNNVIALYAGKIESAGIQVQTEVEFEGELIGLPGELRQVFANLLGNAMEAIGKNGKIRLHAYAGREWRQGRRGLRVTVADNGQGIPAEVRDKIFDPFFTTKGEAGTGLGLWITAGIIENNDGILRLRTVTRDGRSGTCFSVFFPFPAG